MRTNLKENDEYYTPRYILEYFGKFDYDPATTKEIAFYHNIKNYDTKETNGLNKSWKKYKRIWINPPFSNKLEFLKKAKKEYIKNLLKQEIYILIPIEYLITKEFSSLNLSYTLYIPNKRIKFIGSKKTPSFGCVIIKIGYKKKIKNIEVY